MEAAVWLISASVLLKYSSYVHGCAYATTVSQSQHKADDLVRNGPADNSNFLTSQIITIAIIDNNSYLYTNIRNNKN